MCFLMATALLVAVDARAQDSTEVGDKANPEQDPTDVTTEGVPTDAAEADTAAADVQKAVEEVEEEAKAGLPASFTLEFGDTFDWVRLTSGEWLKGNVERMRDKEMEFDSDKLKMLTIDWKDVKELHSPQINTYVFEDHAVVIGRAVITKDRVIVETIDGIVTYPRSDLLSIVEGEGRERNFWSTKLKIGLSANSGNTNQATLTVGWGLAREDHFTRSELTYDGTYGVVDNAANVNRHLGGFGVRIFVWKKWYVTPIVGQLLYDQFQNTKLRATPAAGGGYHIFDTKKVKWDVETAPGYQYLRYLSTAAGVQNPEHDMFILLRTYAEFDFTDDIELKIDWRTNLVVTTIGLTNHVGQAEFSLEITDIFDFNVSFLYLRTENPATKADGTVPSKNDYQFIVGVELEIG